MRGFTTSNLVNQLALPLPRRGFLLPGRYAAAHGLFAAGPEDCYVLAESIILVSIPPALPHYGEHPMGISPSGIFVYCPVAVVEVHDLNVIGSNVANHGAHSAALAN